jgi:hypothetical protein
MARQQLACSSCSPAFDLSVLQRDIMPDPAAQEEQQALYAYQKLVGSHLLFKHPDASSTPAEQLLELVDTIREISLAEGFAAIAGRFFVFHIALEMLAVKEELQPPTAAEGAVLAPQSSLGRQQQQLPQEKAGSEATTVPAAQEPRPTSLHRHLLQHMVHAWDTKSMSDRFPELPSKALMFVCDLLNQLMGLTTRDSAKRALPESSELRKVGSGLSVAINYVGLYAPFIDLMDGTEMADPPGINVNNPDHTRITLQHLRTAVTQPILLMNQQLDPKVLQFLGQGYLPLALRQALRDAVGAANSSLQQLDGVVRSGVMALQGAGGGGGDGVGGGASPPAAGAAARAAAAGGGGGGSSSDGKNRSSVIHRRPPVVVQYPEPKPPTLRNMGDLGENISLLVACKHLPTLQASGRQSSRHQ